MTEEVMCRHRQAFAPTQPHIMIFFFRNIQLYRQRNIVYKIFTSVMKYRMKMVMMMLLFSFFFTSSFISHCSILIYIICCRVWRIKYYHGVYDTLSADANPWGQLVCIKATRFPRIFVASGVEFKLSLSVCIHNQFANIFQYKVDKFGNWIFFINSFVSRMMKNYHFPQNFSKIINIFYLISHKNLLDLFGTIMLFGKFEECSFFRSEITVSCIQNGVQFNFQHFFWHICL